MLETEQASIADVRFAEDAALRASEDRREVEDRLETCMATLPALAAAYADTIEAYPGPSGCRGCVPRRRARSTALTEPGPS